MDAAEWPMLERRTQQSLTSEADIAYMRQKEYWSCLALRHTAGLGRRRCAKLVRRYGSAFNALANIDAWPELGIPANVSQSAQDEKWRDWARREWDSAQKQGARVLLWTDSEYPRLLREIYDAPIMLYYAGDLALLANPCVAIVGSRAAAARNLGVAEALASSLAGCGITVVSGMAGGIDGASHRGALRKAGRSIGVLGTGIGRRYPQSNAPLYDAMADCGLLLSEFAPQEPPQAANFPIRNRIISGLSLAVVVVEAALKSGSLITAKFALEQNREVFAAPGSALDTGSIGCQNLIRQGAHPVFSHEDILRELAFQLKQYRMQEPADLSLEPEKTAAPLFVDRRRRDRAQSRPGAGSRGHKSSDPIVRCLASQGSMHMDALAEELGLEVGDLSGRLVILEMQGAVRRLPGARFEAL